MATLAVTVAVPGNAGATFRALAKAIERAAVNLSDTNGSGASATLTIDNAPSAGVASVVVAGAGLATQTTYFV